MILNQSQLSNIVTAQPSPSQAKPRLGDTKLGQNKIKKPQTFNQVPVNLDQ